MRVNLAAVVALSDQTVASVRMHQVLVVVINRVIIIALALAIASWVKNQLDVTLQIMRLMDAWMVKNLMAQEAGVLMTAIKSAHKMARALHAAALVTEMTALHLVTVLHAMMRRIVSVLLAATNLLATANHVKDQK